MDEERRAVHEAADRRNNLKLPEFTLLPKEVEAFEAFSEQHLKVCAPSTDMLHHRWSVTFTPNGIGTGVLVKCLLCGAKEDITDIDSW